MTSHHCGAHSNNSGNNHDHHGHSHAPSPEKLAVATSEEVAECPVMEGTPVIKAEAEESGLYRDYQGKRYWLCCEGCGPLFDAAPEEYAHSA